MRCLLGAVIVAVAIIGLGWSVAGCAGTPRPDTPDPARAYERAVLERVAALQATQDAAETPLPFTLRFNPVPCGCPPWEVTLGDVWQRAKLDESGDADAIAALTDRADRDDTHALSWQVHGSLDDELSACGSGALVVSLNVIAFPLPASAGEDDPASAGEDDPASAGEDDPASAL